jgi:hypothetical protein
VTDLAPLADEALRLGGFAALDTGRPALACRLWHALAERHPGDALVRDALATALDALATERLGAGAPEEAVVHWQRAVELVPSSAVPRTRLVHAHQTLAAGALSATPPDLERAAGHLAAAAEAVGADPGVGALDAVTQLLEGVRRLLAHDTAGARRILEPLAADDDIGTGRVARAHLVAADLLAGDHAAATAGIARLNGSPSAHADRLRLVAFALAGDWAAAAAAARALIGRADAAH